VSLDRSRVLPWEAYILKIVENRGTLILKITNGYIMTKLANRHPDWLANKIIDHLSLIGVEE
jgi:hypothetical protein